MQYLLIPFRVLYKLYYLILFVISLLLLFPINYFLLSDPKYFPVAFKLMRLHAKVMMLLAGDFIKVIGKNNIPEEGAYFICPNHTSYLDIFCIYSMFKKYFVFTGKKEIEKWPIFHRYYTSGMNILVDRHSKTGSLKAIKRMAQEIELGNPIVVFPEGTISRRAPILAPFKSGAFAIAIQKQVPILPITFVSNWKLLQRGSFWFGQAGPGLAEVVIHELVQTKGLLKNDLTHLQNQVKNAINIPLLKNNSS